MLHCSLIILLRDIVTGCSLKGEEEREGVGGREGGREWEGGREGVGGREGGKWEGEREGELREESRGRKRVHTVHMV